MKKLVIVLAIVASVGIITSPVLACMWYGYWGGPAGGSMMVAWGGYGSGVDNSGAYRNFMNDTANLRQELAAKQGKHNALMTQNNPDGKQAAQLSPEVTRLHDQLRARAQSSRLPGPGSYNTGYGPRYGR